MDPVIYAPDSIDHLEPHECFTFGSNTRGRHGRGAALQALRWGAKEGVGLGHEGQTYAIPTKDDFIRTLPLERIASYVTGFLFYAAAHPKVTFLVTAIGTGLASYRPDQIGPLFAPGKVPRNVLLPRCFHPPYAS